MRKITLYLHCRRKYFIYKTLLLTVRQAIKMVLYQLKNLERLKSTKIKILKIVNFLNKRGKTQLEAHLTLNTLNVVTEFSLKEQILVLINT